MVAAEEAVLLVNDLAIQRGYGIFDFFKTLHDRPIFLDDHVDRFFYSAAQMRLPVPESRPRLKELIAELMAQNKLPNSGVKITLTGGYSADGYTMMQAPNMIITQAPLPVASTVPVRLVSYAHQRQMSHVKTIDYLMAIWLQPFVQEHQADDLLYHQDGVVTECPRANFFIVTNEGTIATPANNMLKGIIRSRLLRHFDAAFLIEERDVTLDEVYEANEAFITSTTKNILSVAEVDGRTIGNGEPGEITSRLASKLQEVINDEHQS